jgi:hypothetical protein
MVGAGSAIAFLLIASGLFIWKLCSDAVPTPEFVWTDIENDRETIH